MIADALWTILPVILGGLTHVVAIHLKVLPRLAALPIDGGRTHHGKRIFGDNKTWRGVIVMTAACAAWGALQGIGAALGGWTLPALLVESGLDAGLWGGLLGLGYIVGELPNSYLKRRHGIAPGAPATGPRRALFWLVDQVDSLFGVLACMCLAVVPSFSVVLVLLSITLILHPAVAALMVGLGLKDRVG